MEEECPKCPQGLPAWLATFADLMSLLMCFFVLLLSFATMDAVRFKKMAESMKDAFGVQREIPTAEIVKGISVIKTEFSATVSPDPTIVDEVRQQTTDEEQIDLQVLEDAGEQGQQDNEMSMEQMVEAVQEQIAQEIEDKSRQLQEALKEEIEQGLISIETENTRIVIRVQEKGSFPSGSDRLDPGFFDVLDRIATELASTPGNITVAGHTDNIPIKTARFRSNWELASARAVTVVHGLLSHPDLDMERVTVESHADTKPLVANDSVENRSKNRRVELILVRGGDDEIREGVEKLQAEQGQTNPQPGAQ